MVTCPNPELSGNIAPSCIIRQAITKPERIEAHCSHAPVNPALRNPVMMGVLRRMRFQISPVR
jgi:hypothetical protein